MNCPYCHIPDSSVIDSRVSKDGELIRRRRECSKCQRRFTTYERVEETLPIVVKKDGRRESFDRLKIINGIRKACEKRPVSTKTIDELVDRVERSVLDLGETEIKSSALGERIMHELHQLDEIAYVRFASVYRSFKDINEFMQELSDLLQRQK
ncbi:MAG: transcriptional regulator NrdR [Deltaproteobacteria bacterium RIFCSPLOWO2_02_FULL_44_10]|nr:MAG: transcriptional regulator NrdR [Deltaproteobacteria bacterium RIFCSPHIGHO2_02_FULL_44_16]OGQ46050.1 MAG: transcriptional regulator NrdR [Deltaproteobacteria bacterium RIFCSPLOWO2_02_FULL_44_10]